MKFVLTRKDAGKNGIFGELRNEKFELEAYTLEHAYDDGAGCFVPKVAAGKYTCQRGEHLLDHMTTPFSTFMLLNVPDFQGKKVSGILIHWGNFNKDSNGCILVGESIAYSIDGKMITNSKAAFKEFMEKTEGLDTIELEIV